MSDSTVLVRLKPYNRRRGHVLRCFTIYSMRFKEKNGWYEVEEEVADMLRAIKQPPIGDRLADEMPAAFDIMAKDEAEAYEEAERKRIEERAKAISPHRMNTSERAKSDLTTDDLPGNQEDKDPPAKKSSSSSRGKRRSSK